MRLQTRRWEIANEIMMRATSYDSVHPEEGVIDYPNGWMGRATLEVGIAIDNWSDYQRSLTANELQQLKTKFGG